MNTATAKDGPSSSPQAASADSDSVASGHLTLADDADIRAALAARAGSSPHSIAGLPGYTALQNVRAERRHNREEAAQMRHPQSHLRQVASTDARKRTFGDDDDEPHPAAEQASRFADLQAAAPSSAPAQTLTSTAVSPSLASADTSTDTSSSTSSSAMTGTPTAASFGATLFAVTPTALPAGDSRRPPPPESPTPGLVIGTGGLIGGTGGAIDPVTTALLDPNNPYYESGALKLSKDNVTTAYGGGVTITVAGLPVTVPISVENTLTAADGTLFGTGANQHLTLLGGVTSDSYITNINNGATNGGIINSSDPAWSDSCLNVDIGGLLGVDVPCWGVNAAQNNQVLIGDGAYANGSEEVVIGTGARHSLASVDANTVFPGDGNRDSVTDPMGVPDSDYQSRLGHSVVIGDNANGTADAQTILGANASSTQPNSVVLGYGSVASRAPASGYTDAYGLIGMAQNSAGAVSIGADGYNRQITHLAAGQQDYDAVNVLQLRTAISSVDATTSLAVLYDDDGTGNPSNSVTLVGDGTGAPVGIHNLDVGKVDAASTDAINGSQLYDTNSTIAQYFGGTTAYDGTTNTWTAPSFAITSIDSAGNTTSGTYDNVTDAFAALDGSLTNVNDRISNIYSTGIQYFHANSTGPDSVASGADAVAVGTSATASGIDAVAIGNGATAGDDHSIALGDGSATTVGAQTGYTAYALTAPQTSVGEVNIGNRQLTGLAAGSAPGDAVNVAQLQAVNDQVGSLDNLAVLYDDDGTGNASNSVTLVGDGTGAAVGIHNLDVGEVSATSTDAVNGSQLYDTNSTIAQYFGGTTAYDSSTGMWTAPSFVITSIDGSGNGTTSTYNNVTDAFAALDGSLTNVNNRIDNISNGAGLMYFHANSAATDSQAMGTDSVAIGGDAMAAGTGSFAAGNGAQAMADDAVAVGDGAQAMGGQSVSVGAGNIANGAGAVSIGDPNVATGDGAVALGMDNTATGNGAVAIGQTNSAIGDGAVAMGISAQSSATGALAFGNGATASVVGGVALGSGSVADRTGSGAELFSGVAIPAEGVVSVGASGAERQITNVAGGTADTDAVNVRQLRAVDNKITGLSDLAVTYDDVTRAQVTLNSGGAAVLVTNLAPGAITAVSTDAINGAQLYYWTQDTGNIYSNYSLYNDIQNLSGGGTVSGPFVVNNSNGLPPPDASGDNSAAGGSGATASGSDSTAVGNGATASASNAVALGAGSVADRDNTVSVGADGNERQITHVAAGTEATDAVNVEQLQASTQGTVRYDSTTQNQVDYGSVTLGGPGGGTTTIHNVAPGSAPNDAVNVSQLNDGIDQAVSWANQYTDQQVAGFNDRINRVNQRAQAGVASAMAMAGLPQAYLPGRNMASVAAGSFHGESSIAVGVSMISDNGRWVYKLSGTANTRGDTGMSVGAGIQW